MAINYIAAEFKPFYTPFDYSFPPCKEYIPPIPFESLEDDLRDRALELFENKEHSLFE